MITHFAETHEERILGLNLAPGESDEFIDFDPNKLPESEPLWAVYSETRLRTFRGRGPALTSFMHSSFPRDAKLYEFVDGSWVLRALRTTQPKTVCDRCRRPIDLKDRKDWRKHTWAFKRDGTKIATPLELQFICRQGGCR